AQLLPFLRIDMCLVQDAAQRTHWDFRLPRNNGSVHDLALSPDELDVTALLAGFDEPRGFQPALDLTEGLRLKPPQPRPRSFALWPVASPVAVRSAVPALPSNSPALPLPSGPGSRHRPQGTARHTSPPPAIRSLRM